MLNQVNPNEKVPPKNKKNTKDIGRAYKIFPETMEGQCHRINIQRLFPYNLEQCIVKKDYQKKEYTIIQRIRLIFHDDSYEGDYTPFIPKIFKKTFLLMLNLLIENTLPFPISLLIYDFY